jgi:hypothetical protein
MKTLFVILFFVVTGLLVCLAYLFLQMIDSGGKPGFLFLDFAGIILSIILLIIFLRNYLKQPPNRSR